MNDKSIEEDNNKNDQRSGVGCWCVLDLFSFLFFPLLSREGSAL